MNSSFLDFTLYRLPESNFSAERIKGEGQRSIGLLFECSGPEKEELVLYLDKILQAAKINRLTDVKSLHVTPDERISLHQFPQWKEIHYWLIFGIAPDRLGLQLQLKPYTPTPFAGAAFLWSDSLHAIWQERQDGGKKMSGQLWQALKQLFL